jgi:tetratricopeptide (TPR) repeat protein
MRYSKLSGLQGAVPKRWVRRFGLVLAGTGLTLLPLIQPVWAGDPFRPNDPHEVSDTSEQIFYAMFRDGNYVEARKYLDNADFNAYADPLFHALGAAFDYLDQNWEGLLAKSQLTKQAANDLADSDPLRSNLYEAVGLFLEGAYILQTEGIAQGTPKALSRLQQVFDLMDAAAAIAPDDPELNLLKGYMDLLLSVNLPFANPERAIAQLQSYGYPPYVSYRGIALGYRDLDRNGEALEAVNVAISEAPNNPDLLYLKAQILQRLERNAESLEFFNQALTYADQLPPETLKQIAFEQCQATGEERSVCRDRANATIGS